uniref:Uncharacterized protein n=1 Tax=Romanomermis culicivorax TaxID=13658 RepID=A0A915L864_ROMCU
MESGHNENLIHLGIHYFSNQKHRVPYDYPILLATGLENPWESSNS